MIVTNGSGSISSPHWGSFHLSLTVLVHYRSVSSIFGLVRYDRISRVPSLLRILLNKMNHFKGRIAPPVNLSRLLYYDLKFYNAVLQPPVASNWFALFQVFAATIGISLFSSGYSRCFPLRPLAALGCYQYQFGQGICILIIFFGYYLY